MSQNAECGREESEIIPNDKALVMCKEVILGHVVQVQKLDFIPLVFDEIDILVIQDIDQSSKDFWLDHKYIHPTENHASISEYDLYDIMTDGQFDNYATLTLSALHFQFFDSPFKAITEVAIFSNDIDSNTNGGNIMVISHNIAYGTTEAFSVPELGKSMKLFFNDML